MNNIFVFNCIITADYNSNKVFIASLDKEDVVFPVSKIEKPKFLYNEIRYNIKNLFEKETIKFLEEINLSFLDIQNYLLLELLSNEEKNIYQISDDNIILLCGTVIHSKLNSDQIYWLPVDGILNVNDVFNNLDITKQIISYVFEKTIL